MSVSYPHLTEILREIALDNGMRMKPESEFEWWRVSDVDHLEGQAARLNSGEKQIFAAGEHEEVLQMAKDARIMDLHEFLNKAFDGDYYDCFYEEF